MIILEKIKFRKLLNVLVILPVLVIFSLFITLPVQAASKTSIELNIDYQVSSIGEVKITNAAKYSNNTPNTILTFASQGTFSLTPLKKYTDETLMWKNLDQELKSMSVKVNNSVVSFTSKKTTNGYEIYYNQGFSIRYKQSLTVTYEYISPELIERIGKIYNIYIPESPQIDLDLKSKYDVSIKTKALVSKDLGPIHFATEEYTKSGNDYLFNFQAVDSSKKSHMIQIGDSQIWQFNLVQKVEVDNLSDPNLSEYKVMIPSDDPTLNQKVYYESFDPVPNKVVSLPNGNLEATYYLDKSIKNISVKGYLVQTEKDIPVSDLSSKNIDLKKYLASEIYWEVTDPIIVKAAKDIKNGANTSETIFNVYNFVIGKVDYNNLKLGINNVRQGAVKTLLTGSGVCMEYSDLLITLLRAKGIPSRAVFGYGYIPGESTGESEKHQWVQAYMEGTGWVSIDPTWGSTTRKFIGKDFDHFSWFVSEENVETPKEVSAMWVGNNSNTIENPNIVLSPKNVNPDISKLFTSLNVIEKYKPTQIEDIVYQLRVFIYFPFLIAGLFVIILSVIFTKVIKHFRRFLGS